MSRHYIYRMDICENDVYHGAYIGQHKIGAKAPSCDGYMGSGSKWKKHILGNNIPVTKTILRECDDIDETNYWEEYYINKAIQEGEYLWNIVKGGGGHEADRIYTDEEIKQHNKERCAKWYEANKERHAEYGRQYRKNNRERSELARKRYIENNKEYYLEYHRNYYKNNKEARSKARKEYYEKNKDRLREHMREYSKQYYITHAEQLSEKGRQYYREHKEEHNKYYSQPCCYNGETLTLRALSIRFSRKGISHPTIEAKKYLLDGGI